jgi:thymidylate synthase
MNNLDKQYQNLLQEIIDNGVSKSDRTGTGTKSIFSAQIKHDMKEGFPLLTTKRVYWKGIVTELLWFLRGETNIKWLVENNNNIWVGDAYKNYCKNVPHQHPDFLSTQGEFINEIKTNDIFAKEWGELGPIYGAQWRNWGKLTEPTITYNLGNIEKLKNGIDQIQQAIHTLKTNPDSRRIIVSAWNVGELDNMVLPPCHWAFELYTEELTYDERYEICCSRMSKMYSPGEKDFDEYNVPKRRLSLKWHQRSVDVGLGLGFNIASYGLLLEIMAKQVNMVPGILIGDLTNVHLYLDHIEPIKEQLNRKPFGLSTLKIHGNVDNISHYKINDLEITNYQCHPTIKMPLSN